MRSRSLNGRLLPVWTEAMDAELARLAPTCSAAEIAQAVSAMSGLSISRKAVSRRAYGKGVQLRVGSHASPIWTEAMDIELARLAPTCSASEMARILSPMFGLPITRGAVASRTRRLARAKCRANAARLGKLWSP